MLKVSRNPDGSPEIFYSVQGEGANIGKPAVFLRLGLCNLKCVWCDTKYTWDWNTYQIEKTTVDLPLEVIEQRILQYHRTYLVVTGGEPLLQQDNLLPLFKSLQSHEFDIEVETNGTIIPARHLTDLVYHWSVSPKLQNSGNTACVRESAECYNLFNSLNCSHFKFVVRDNSDFDELQELVKKYRIDARKIILMPEASNREDLLQKSRWLVELCMSTGYRLTTRLQILLWGNERGK